MTIHRLQPLQNEGGVAITSHLRLGYLPKEPRPVGKHRAHAEYTVGQNWRRNTKEL